MGWARGWDERNQQEIGYAISDVCAVPDCDAKIDRGLAYRCGGFDSLDNPSAGCGRYFCAGHLFYGAGTDAVCPTCFTEKEGS